MRGELAESLEHVLASMHQQSDRVLTGAAELVASMRAGAQYPPSTFGLYYEMTSALLAGQYDSARALLDELVQERPLAHSDLSITPLDQVEPVNQQVLYQRLMDTDPETPFIIVPPPPELADNSVRRFLSAANRVRKTLPLLADEFEALVRQVVLVNGAKELDYGFAGGSCYMLWGALFINVEHHADEIALVEAIAHEAGHSFLFGCTIDEPLILNDDTAKFSSPLRDDPRPMDGIYHATYVSARMHWAMSGLLAETDMDNQQREIAALHREADKVNFWAGLSIVEEHGLMSETGRLLMAAATDYMALHAPA